MKISKNFNLLYTLFFLLFLSCNLNKSQDSTAENNEPTHPNLVTTAKGIKLIKANLGKYPLIDNAIKDMKALVGEELTKEKDFPISKDPSGGYSHEKHKSNYLMMYRAGMLYQVLGEKKYATYVKEMLLGYADLFPKPPLQKI